MMTEATPTSCACTDCKCRDGWQPIETAPKDGRYILLGWEASDVDLGRWHDGSANYWKRAGWYMSDDDLLTARPSLPGYWQSLPKPPEPTTA